MNYTRTETKQDKDCLITKDAHVVTIYDDRGHVVGYVATCSTIYYDCFSTNANSQSCVFDNLEEAKEYCEKYFNNYINE